MGCTPITHSELISNIQFPIEYVNVNDLEYFTSITDLKSKITATYD